MLIEWTGKTVDTAKVGDKLKSEGEPVGIWKDQVLTGLIDAEAARLRRKVEWPRRVVGGEGCGATVAGLDTRKTFTFARIWPKRTA